MSEEVHTAEDLPLPGGDFRLFITRQSIQALLALGLLENPLTGTKQRNPPGARMVIDDLLMLREKTAGNLEGDEAAHLNKVIRDLEVAYGKVVGD